MPQFNAYPQNFNVVDMPAIQEQANRRQLQEAQLQKMQAEAQRLQSGQLTPEQDLAERRFGLAQRQDVRTATKFTREEEEAHVADVARRVTPLVDRALSDMEVINRYGEILGRAQTDQVKGVENAPPLGSSAQVIRDWANDLIAQTGEYKTRNERLGTKSPEALAEEKGLIKYREEVKADSGPKGLNQAQAYNALLKEQGLIDAGQEVPIKVRRRAEAARHLLTTPRLVTTEIGQQWMTPGVPTFGKAPSEAQIPQEKIPEDGQPEAAATTPPAAKSGATLEMAVPKANKRDTKLPLATIATIVELLESEPDDFWKSNTGVVGTAKRLGGGLARQAGFEVSDKAARLHRQFAILKGQMVSILLNEENKISDQDRIRLDEIVGGIMPRTDIEGLWGGIADMVDFIADVEARDK